MPKLVVVEKPENWKFSLEDVDVVTPDDYITKESFQSAKNLKVLNLCKSYQYQSEGAARRLYHSEPAVPIHSSR